MIQKIKIFLGSKKKIAISLFFVLLLAVIGTSLPQIGQAAWYDFLINAIGNIAPTLLSVGLFVVLMIASGLVTVSSGLLSWVTGPNFTTLSYTNPANNKIIELGLGVTQGLVNMALVLILVYIALATILRLAGYETRKLLVTFVIVALLVNFSPVICGVIVDATNILMNFFLDKFSPGQVFANQTSTGFDILKAQIGNLFTFRPDQNATLTIQMCVLIGINLILFLILLLFSILFIARYVMIWTLVILSPLAFAAYILPATKKYWSMWWNQFVQWSIIGVTAGFFLYLGNEVASIGPNVFLSDNAPTGFGTILLAAVPAVFNGIGLLFGLQTSAMGASAIMGFAKKGGKLVAKKAWRGVNVPDKLRLREAAGWAAKTAEKVPVARWFVPEPLRKYGEMKGAVDAEKKNITGSSPDEMTRVANGTYTGAKAAATLEEVVKDRGDGEDFVKTYMKKYGYNTNLQGAALAAEKAKFFNDDRFLNDKSLHRSLEILQSSGKLGKFLRADPRLARVEAARQAIRAGKNLSSMNPDDRKKAINDQVVKTLQDTKNSDITNWEKEVLDDPEIMEAALALKGEDAFRAFGSLKNGQQLSLKTVDENFKKWAADAPNAAAITAGGLSASNPADEEKIWEMYMDDLEKKYGVTKGFAGYRKALGSQRFQHAGWRRGTLSGTIVTPGSAAGLPPRPAPKPRRRGTPPPPPPTPAPPSPGGPTP